MTPASRRDQILATAAELFAARGFHGVSVADLGAACGISGPALYKHFPSKDAMLAEMLVSISEELLEVGRRRGSPRRRDPAGRAGAWSTGTSSSRCAHRPLIVVQDRDWESLPGRRPRAGPHPPARVRRPLGRPAPAVPTPGSQPDRARAMAHAAFGLINSTPHSGLLPDPDMHALLRDMALRSLGV